MLLRIVKNEVVFSLLNEQLGCKEFDLVKSQEGRKKQEKNL